MAEVEKRPWKEDDAVARKFVAYKLVPVAEVEKSPWNEEEPLAKMPWAEIIPKLAILARRLVEEANPEVKKSEEVAFWRVVEPRARKLVE